MALIKGTLSLLVACSLLNGIFAIIPHFEHRSRPAISSPLISHASGLAASRRHQEVLYTHNDRASPHPYVFALNASTSALIATLRIFPATNENWEDIAVGPCGNKSCIYILESGNVVHGHQAQKIYRVEEPEFLYSDQILTDASELSFRFQTNHTDNPCEVLMVDPRGYALVISRNNGLFGEVTNSMWGNSGIVDIDKPNILNHHIHHPLAGDISPRGNEILILTKHQIYYWNVHNRYNYKGALSTGFSHTVLESSSYLGMNGICWDKDSLNFYPIPEGQYKNIDFYVRYY